MQAHEIDDIRSETDQASSKLLDKIKGQDRFLNATISHLYETFSDIPSLGHSAKKDKNLKNTWTTLHNANATYEFIVGRSTKFDKDKHESGNSSKSSFSSASSSEA